MMPLTRSIANPKRAGLLAFTISIFLPIYERQWIKQTEKFAVIYSCATAHDLHVISYSPLHILKERHPDRIKRMKKILFKQK